LTIKLLLGGSPCTHWSIAQKKNREIEAAGQGWELFKNYLIAKEKFQPDYFLYENNKSASEAIKSQICTELGTDLMNINSSLVSAQNRQRFYVFNWEVEQPEDRGILLKDILESNEPFMEEGYRIETIGDNATDHDGGIIRIGDIGSTAQAHRIYSPEGKSVTINAGGGGQGGKTGLYATPIKHLSERELDYMVRGTNGKYSDRWTYLQKPDEKDKACCITANIHKGVPYNICAEKVSNIRGENVYCVKDGAIEIKEQKYPIKLQDGYYIIRKLSPIECERLQTLPDNYTAGVSNTQRYKGLGNGWTAEVIIHILDGVLKDIPRDEEIIVLSMYDGIGTGRYCLDKMGFTNIKYYAYEIDNYAMQIALKNYPDIIQRGDAFAVRDEDWDL